jgi:aminoacrylate hydrolase
MVFVQTPQGELYAEETGSGPPLLLIPGLGGRAAFWSNQIEPLSKFFRVITHDHRGAGRSARSVIQYSVEQMANDVLTLMDELKVDCAHAIGHSTGGAVVQKISLDAPSRINKTVLSATWAGPNAFFEELFKLRKKILMGLGPESYFIDGMLRAYPASFLTSNAGYFTGNLSDRLKSFPGMEIECSRIDAVVAHDLRSRIHEIQKETLVICALDDQITPISLSKELCELLPNAKLHEAPFGGHFYPQVAADDYNREVINFLLGGKYNGPATRTI